jgi:hypothetical protein
MASGAEKVIAKLAEAQQSGRLDGVTIEYWVGGGLPPPHYRSDQLRLLPEDGGDVVEFAKMRFDDHYDPPSLNDKWRVPATSAEVRSFARLLQESAALTKHYPEEDNPRIADILSTEVIVSYAGEKIERRYFRKLPDALAPLRAAAEALIERAKRQGSWGLYHQGQRLPDATEPPKP